MNKPKKTTKSNNALEDNLLESNAEIKEEIAEESLDLSSLSLEALNIIQDLGAQIENLARVTLAQKFIVVSLSEKEPKFHFNQEKFEKCWQLISGETEENAENLTENT